MNVHEFGEQGELIGYKIVICGHDQKYEIRIGKDETGRVKYEA